MFRTGTTTALALSVLLLLLGVPGCQGSKSQTLSKGSALPDIELPTTAGEKFRIPGDIKGKLTVILFWSTGCHYCKKEMPSIEPLYRKYHGRGFEFIAVHMGPEMDEARDLGNQMGLSFPIAVDRDSSLRKLYGVVSVPTMFVLDSNRLLVEKILGGLGADDIEKMITESL